MEIDLRCTPVAAEDLAARLAAAPVCIIGGGIAGLVLAFRLAELDIRVTLLEAGAREAVADGDDPFGAELAGKAHRGTREGRVCGLGGCSVTWGGQLLPLPDDVRWPVSRAELEPFEAEAQQMLGAAALPFGAEPFFRAVGQAVPLWLPALDGLEARLSQFVPFGKRNLERRLGAALRRHPHVQVVLGAKVERLRLNGGGAAVGGALVRTGAGVTVCVRARQFVLAAGTVESCRLLLASGIDGGRQVGRRFHDHLTVAACTFTGPARRRVLAALGPWVSRQRGSGSAVHSVKLEPGASLRAELGLLPAMAHLTIEEPEGAGVGAVRALLRARQQAGWSWRGAARQVTRLPGALWQGLWLLWTARVRRRRYVSRAATVRLQLNVAQAPGMASRVELSDAVDSAGQRRARVVWSVQEEELATLRGVTRLLRERLEALGCDEGAVWVPALMGDDDAALLAMLDDARHAMGGACMGVDPETSVVDPALQMHGVRNLSVASAAVFPDGSAQLPTLTLAALCLRLAERLAREVAAQK